MSIHKFNIFSRYSAVDSKTLQIIFNYSINDKDFEILVIIFDKCSLKLDDSLITWNTQNSVTRVPTYYPWDEPEEPLP